MIDGQSRRRYRLRGAPIIHDTIDNETIAINQLTGAYYSLEGPAALVWLMLADGVSVDEAATRLAARYSPAAGGLTTQVQAFLDELLAEELIVAEPDSEPAAGSGNHAEPASPTDAAREPLPGLRLQRYTDLEVMLLADPIHEVDDTGWPMPYAERDR